MNLSNMGGSPDRTGYSGDLDKLRAVHSQALNLIRDRALTYRGSWEEQELKELWEKAEEKLAEALDLAEMTPVVDSSTQIVELLLDSINYISMLVARIRK